MSVRLLTCISVQTHTSVTVRTCFSTFKVRIISPVLTSSECLRVQTLFYREVKVRGQVMSTRVLTSVEVQTCVCLCSQLFSVKSRQMPRTSCGINSARPVNSLVKKVWLSFGSDDIDLRSSIGAQATPTE